MRHRWRKAVGYVMGAALLVVGAGPAHAAFVTLGPEADAQISDGGPFLENMNRGGETSMYIGDAGAPNFKALVRFDISGIPAGQQITSATLELTIVDGTQIAGNVHRIEASWEEGTNFYPNAGGAGVTWHDRGTALPNWVAAGLNDPADRDPTPSASFSAANVTAGVLNIDLTGDVQDWYGGAEANHGWLLVHTAAPGYTGYVTKEGNPALAPRLTIEYEPVPEPASAALLGGAALLLARRNRAIR